jgi:hypothetical protein
LLTVIGNDRNCPDLLTLFKVKLRDRLVAKLSLVLGPKRYAKVDIAVDLPDLITTHHLLGGLYPKLGKDLLHPTEIEV